jgi:hypothetical protein
MVGDSRRLLKFKYGGSHSEEDSKKTFVKFEKERDDGSFDLFTFECDDEVHPDLTKALQAMKPHLLENCELPDDRLVDVKSITCTYKAMDVGEVRGLVISGVRQLQNSNAPMVLTMPHKTDQPYTEDGDDRICLSSACLDDLDRLSEEVFAYVDGKRAQLEMDFQGEDEPAA